VSTTTTPLPPAIDVLQRRAYAVGAAGLIAALIGALTNTSQFFHSYLLAFLFWNGIVLGCLSLLMIQHLTGGRWGLAIRRLLEAATRTVPVMALLFLPVAFGMKRIYPWAAPELFDPTIRHAAELKHLYLNVPFFLGRAAFYFAVWFGLSLVLNRWSLEEDSGWDLRRSRRMRGVSGGGLLLMGLTITFMSVDWAMSLDPRWFSSIYGMLFMIGTALSALSFCIVLIALVGTERPVSVVADAETIHDLGKLMLAFVMVWAYISFSQFLIIWSGNLPEEITWYLRRFNTGWRFVGLFLVVFHFALPFLLLLSRNLKRRPRTLARIAAIVLLARLVDLAWLVQPELRSSGFPIHWLDVALAAGLGGVWLGVFAGQLKTRPLLPVGEPEVREILAGAEA
jgi:hypothetical protein